MSINASPSGSGNSGGGGGGGGGSSSGGGGGGGPCGACKFLRRKCVPGCVFAPYFDSEQGASHFAAVHKVFGASNVSKLLLNIPVHKRLDAVITICYEAQSRLRDPVYGCVSHIFALQQQVVNLQAELSYVQGHLAQVELPHPQPPRPPQAMVSLPRAFPATDVPTNSASSMPGTYDLSSLWDPMVQAAWAAQQRPLDPRQYAGSGLSPILTGCGGGSGGGCSGSSSGGGDGGSDDFQALVRELLRRDGSPREVPLPSPNASSTPSRSKGSS